MTTIQRIAALGLISFVCLGCGPGRPPTFAELLSQADDATDDERYARAVTLLEQALAMKPDDEVALERYTRALHDRAMDLIGDGKAAEGLTYCEKAQEAHKKFRKLHEGKPGLAEFDEVEKEFLKDLIYDEACASALTGDKKRAMKCLQEAYAIGFDDIEWIEDDDDLNGIRTMPEYTEFIKKARREGR
jgi:tetratricopeptide (TPR) repeat protein